MYDKLFNTACGMFNSLHFLVIGLFFAVLWLLLRASRRLNKEKVSKLLLSVAICVTILEIIKIAVRIRGNEGPDSWIPLYYCSLFIFAAWFSVSPWKPLRTAGLSYMTMGGIAASIFFVFYPSTALGMYPLFHPSTLHSLLYHLIMCYCGLLVLQKRLYIPRKRDLTLYAIFVFTACVLAVPVNALLGTNCMFLAHPFGLPFLDVLQKTSKPLYMLIVAFAQSVCMFCACYQAYHWMSKHYSKEVACAEAAF